MRKIMLLSMVFCALHIIGFSQKLEGPVLRKELVGKYEGDQKKGLAHGTGKAIGKDTYTGEFRKGLPDGKGVYTDSLGNVFNGSFRLGKKNGQGVFTLIPSSNEHQITGYWKDDKYIGKEKVDPYAISNKTGSVSPRIFNTGLGNKIEISILDPVNNSYISATILIIGQGTSRNSYGKYYYDDVNFPVEFDIAYSCNNKYKSGMIANTIRIKINTPGSWVITLKN